MKSPVPEPGAARERSSGNSSTRTPGGPGSSTGPTASDCIVAAKVAVAQRDWPGAQRHLSQAATLGNGQWHVNRRLELVNLVRQGRSTPEPPANWAERFMGHCATCSQPTRTPLSCAKCVQYVKPPATAVNFRHVDEHYSLGVYRWQGDPESCNALSRMIRWLKAEKGDEVLRYLAYLLSCGIRTETQFLQAADILVPVPPDPNRRQERGFNNVTQLARYMESYCVLPIAEEMLVKTKATDDLRQMNRHERRGALTGSIEVNSRKRHLAKETTILIVDDVVTSGATLDTCAQALKEAGATRVLAATLARSESSQASERAGERDPEIPVF